jgi:hypothetical protein
MNPNIELLIRKRFQTTMIGALYQFEKNFGHLWGIDLDEDELSNRQLDMRDSWEDTRNSILNNGNNQLRQVMNELTKLIGPPKYHYKLFKHNPNNEDNQ